MRPIVALDERCVDRPTYPGTLKCALDYLKDTENRLDDDLLHAALLALLAHSGVAQVLWYHLKGCWSQAPPTTSVADYGRGEDQQDLLRLLLLTTLSSERQIVRIWSKFDEC